jgi:hypothetical protein
MWQQAVLLLAQFAMSEDPSTAFSALQLLFDGLLMVFKVDGNGLFWHVDLSHLRSTLFIAYSSLMGRLKNNMFRMFPFRSSSLQVLCTLLFNVPHN